MTPHTLSRTEASHLHAAAAHDGRLLLAATMKPASRERLIGRFLRDGLIMPLDEPDGAHRLTAAGYRATGLTPPKAGRRRTSAAKARTGTGAPAVEPAPCPAPYPAPRADAAPADPAPARAELSKKAQVRALLEREQGATLAELIAATGWLPHTVRAALSRIRSGGQALARTARPDAAMAYRILPALSAAGARSRGKIRTAAATAAGGPRGDAPAEAAA